MVEHSRNLEVSQKELLRKWAIEANYELLPTEKALDLVGIIPASGTTRVTCRPTGIEDTLKFVEHFSEEANQKIIPNIAARRFTDKHHFDEIFTRLLSSGTRKIFVVGGDGKPFGNYSKAEDLLVEIYRKGIHFDEIGIGGYPEGNSVFEEDPTEILLRKQEIGEIMQTKMEIVTQMCFDTDVLLNWVNDIRNKGVYLPIRVGIPGCLSLDTLMKAMAMSGITDSLALLKSKPKLVKSLTSIALEGFKPGDLMSELASSTKPNHGISGVSIFTFGNVTKSVKYLSGLSVS